MPMEPMEPKAMHLRSQRLTSWPEWLDFAREVLLLPHDEACEYATARFVEDENRARLASRAGADAPRDPRGVGPRNR
jgi:hypothetical protein